MTPAPSADIWTQFPIIAVLVICIVMVAGAFYKLWKDLIAWQEKQNEARDAERDKQREWEAAQAKTRDAQWQSFLQTMQNQWLANDKRNNEVLERLVDRIDELTVSINNHDTFVRASGMVADRSRSARNK
ncbi:MAG: hypothetical protein CVU44_20985 [Chloroflexi bacterium HGW-Chloroflexi-6]|nr:MAG: hypothetical protein CVU44_20985 [Chloroflexi bacterium HGW-Chloroflexi-6]